MNYFKNRLHELEQKGNLRTLYNIDELAASTDLQQNEFVNLSSNDYLSLASDSELRREFFEAAAPEYWKMSAASSRLLTGNMSEYIQLEEKLCELYKAESALVVGSGYHANSGILPAICTDQTLVLADKLIHASIVDGIQLSKGKHIRYRHNDYHQLERLVVENHLKYDKIIIVTESVFSMDGDCADLKRLVMLKSVYPNLLLYIDEAHAVGIFGPNGLGLCEELNCLQDIDILVGTFGKALGSVGAFVICNSILHHFLVNTMRTLIFTTALPPVNLAWTRFILNKLGELKEKRVHLLHIASLLHQFISRSKQPKISTTHIIPFIIGESEKATLLSQMLRKEGFHILPVRPPSVPEGTSRLRISLCADITELQVEKLISLLERYDCCH